MAEVAFDVDKDAPGAKPSRRQLEKALEHETRIAETLREIGQALGAALSLPELLELIVGRLTELVAADRASLYLVDEASQELRSEVTSGGAVHPLVTRIGQGIAGTVARSGRPLRIDDAKSDPRFDAAWDQAMGYQTQSVLAAPLKNKLGRVIGVLQVHSPQGRAPFSDEDEAILSAVSTQAAVAIDNSRLLGSLIRNNRQLSATKDQLERRLRDLELMFELERATAHATSREGLADSVLERLARACDARGAALLLRDEETGLFVEYARDRERAALVTRGVQAGEGLLSGVLAGNARVRFGAGQLEAKSEVGLPFAVQSFLAEPLEGAEGAFGALGLFNKEGGQFTEEDVSLLRLVGANVATAVRLHDTSRAREREERLSSIGRLLSQVIHDFKSPMTVISGYVQLMEESNEPAERRKCAEEILRQFDAVASMQREVLAFARGESDVFVRRVYVDRFFEDLRRQLEQELKGRSVELAIELQPKIVARFDSERVTRALLNLARNAVEAMAGGVPGGGTAMLTVGARRDGENLVFSVADNGPGISEPVRSRLFQSFVTSGKEGGTGLGLAIVRRIAVQHGGDVSVSSAPGNTRFELRLPQKASEASKPTARSGGTRTESPGKRGAAH